MRASSNAWMVGAYVRSVGWILMAATVFPEAGASGAGAEQDLGACAVSGKEIDGLELADVLVRSACTSPKVRSAWMALKEQREQVGVSRAGFWPQISASYVYSETHQSEDIPAFPFADSSNDSIDREAGLQLSYTLFDFGYRSANVKNAKLLVAAASDTLDDTLQSVILDGAQAYYDLLDAQAARVASEQTATDAAAIMRETDAKFHGGVASIADKLLAQSKVIDADSKVATSLQTEQTAKGTLAILMGLPATTLLAVPEDSEQSVDRGAELQPVAQLLARAEAQNPKVQAAQAKLAAAEASVAAARVNGLPTVSLIGSLQSNSMGYPAGTSRFTLDQIPGNTIARDRSVGFQVNVPIFAGFQYAHQLRAARAQAKEASADVADVQMQVTQEVWGDFQTAQTARTQIQNAQDYLQAVSDLVRARRARYTEGLDNLVNVLNAEDMLSDAKLRGINALSLWRTARAKLAADLGTLSMFSTQW